MVSFSLPVAWGLARKTTTMQSMNNLSPLQTVLLRSRLERIKTGIRNDYSSQIFSSSPGLETAKIDRPTDIFIFPGAGGVDELVLELQASNPNSKIIDWKEYRGSILTASFDSEAVGEAIAEMVLEHIDNQIDEKNGRGDKLPRMLPPSLSSIRFIGISVGAFAANAAATILHRQLIGNKSKSKDGNDCRGSLDVHLVLLDPFCGRGILGTNYGRDNFGKYATTALQILNTDDPVPSTNDSLPFCCCIDVTDAPQKKDFVLLPGDSMHSWPLAYYARHYDDDSDEMNRPDSASPIFPRGKIKKIT